MANDIRRTLKGLMPNLTEGDIDDLFRKTVVLYRVTASTAVAVTNVWYAPETGRVISVTFVPDDALPAAAANYITLLVTKNPSPYTTPVTVATHSTNSTGGTAMAAETPWALTMTTTEADRNFVATDAFQFTLTDNGTTTEPAGVLVMEYILENT